MVEDMKSFLKAFRKRKLGKLRKSHKLKTAKLKTVNSKIESYLSKRHVVPYDIDSIKHSTDKVSRRFLLERKRYFLRKKRNPGIFDIQAHKEMGLNAFMKMEKDRNAFAFSPEYGIFIGSMGAQKAIVKERTLKLSRKIGKYRRKYGL